MWLDVYVNYGCDVNLNVGGVVYTQTIDNVLVAEKLNISDGPHTSSKVRAHKFRRRPLCRRK
jgi:hypothetical protein